MTNIEKYKHVFIALFDVQEKELQKLTYQGVDGWDSVGHMTLITELEDAFNIMIETDDIISFDSFQKGKEIVKKYDVEL